MTHSYLVKVLVTKVKNSHTLFQEPRERDALGLAYKTDDEVELGQKMLDAEIRGEPMPDRQVPGPAKRAQPRPAKAGSRPVATTAI